MADSGSAQAASGDWYVVAVAPRREVTVTQRSAAMGVSTFYPSGRQVHNARGRQFHRQVAVMPGYVFVHVDDPKLFGRYRRDLDDDGVVPGCHGFVGSGGPEKVPEEVVGDLMSRAARGVFDEVEREGRYWAPRWLRSGRRVRVTEGPFKDHVGEVWRMTGERRLSLWLTMLGGLRLVECDIDQVARAAR